MSLAMRTSICLLIVLAVSACKKEDRLQGVYDAMEGTYVWDYSVNYTVFGPDEYINPSSENQTASFVLDDQGQISFYRNGELIVTKNYKIEIQENTPTDSSTFYSLGININVSKLKLDLHNQSPLYISLQDSIGTTNQFPVPAIFGDRETSNYFIKK